MESSLAPVVFFCYNRPDHTREVLESLSRNKFATESMLHIYIDGPRVDASPEAIASIEQVKEVVREKKWCKEVFIVESDVNKGLIKSIIGGVTQVVNKYGKVIVLEDDILTSPGFLEFMNNALDFYEETDQVMHISGFSREDLRDITGQESTYFYYHTSCWGWATWKRAWDKFVPDPMAIWKAAKAKGNIKRLNMDHTFEFFWGLKAVAKGKLRSWNAMWHATVFLNDGLCLHPGRSLVSNIGHDGSGTNCVPGDQFKIDDELLAKHIAVEKIPLVNHEAIRRQYIKLHSLKYRLTFRVKHYLRFLMRY